MSTTSTLWARHRTRIGNERTIHIPGDPPADLVHCTFPPQKQVHVTVVAAGGHVVGVDTYMTEMFVVVLAIYSFLFSLYEGTALRPRETDDADDGSILGVQVLVQLYIALVF